MPLLTERQLLDWWERGFAAPPSVQAGALLMVTDAVLTPDALAAMTLGERERALLSLRRALLGSRMNAVADCPHCDERHDVEFDVDSLLASAPAQIPTTVAVRHDDFALTVRPLTIADYEAASAYDDVESAAEALATWCVLEAQRNSEPIEPQALPAAVRATISNALTAADPLCELTTDLTCANCGEHWTAELDTAAYLWRELHAWAERLLRDVDALAAAYGWTEEDVLRLSPWRRAAYTALAGR
jgi:hypothetical protein